MGRVEGAPGLLSIDVVASERAGHTECRGLQLPAGSTLADAVTASGLVTAAQATSACGIWGRVQPPDTVLRDRDRVEIYRPLLVDPKEARRLRYKRRLRDTTG